MEDDLPEGEPILGRTIRADGWVYRDIPWMIKPLWDQLMTALGTDNVVILASSATTGMVRGQVFISPEGMRRLKTR